MPIRTKPPDASAIRSALGLALAREHRRTRNTVIVRELGLMQGKVVADVVVVNGELHGYEIKSDRDSLRRLDHQVQVYGQTLDRASVVVGEKFASRAEGLVPSWWGVGVARRVGRRVSISWLRRGDQNPERSARSVVQLLWRDDAVQFLRERHALNGLSNAARKYMWERICELYSLDEIAERVRERLKVRATNGSLVQLS